MPSNSLYKRTLSENGQVPVGILTGKGRTRRFAKILSSILKRKDLTPAAKLVLLVMDMESYGADVVGLSDSVIAAGSGIARTTALSAKQELAKVGLIAAAGRPIKQVQPFKLLYRQAEEQSLAKNQRRCTTCQRPRTGPIGPGGICRTCIRAANVERKVAAVLTKSPNATDEQVYVAVKADGAKGILSAVRKLRGAA